MSKTDDLLREIGFGEAATSPPSGRKMNELNRLANEVSQAHARGLLTDSEYTNIREQVNQGSKQSWIQHVLFDMPASVFTDTSQPTTNPYSGGFLENVGDVFSLGGYASTAYFNEAMKTQEIGEGAVGVKNPWGIGGALGGGVAGAFAGGPVGAVLGAGIGLMGGTFFDPGASLEGFAESWRNRETYTRAIQRGSEEEDTVGNLALGIAADIMLDPTTYLTFGVSTGMKVAATASMKGAAKGMGKTAKGISALEAGQEVALTRFGKRMYKISASDLSRKFAKQATERGGLDMSDAMAQHHEILEHMVRNFEPLSQELVRRSKQSRWRMLSVVGEARRDIIRGSDVAKRWDLGFAADDMFQETASAWAKERLAVDVGGKMKALAGIEGATIFGKQLPRLFTDKVGERGIVGKTFDAVSLGWDAPEELMVARRRLEHSVSSQVNDAATKYSTKLAALTEEQRGDVSRIIEQRVFGAMDIPYGAVGTKYSDEVEEAVTFVTKELEDIRLAEEAAGLDVLNARGYIKHMYQYNPRIKTYMKNAVEREGAEAIDAKNGFQQHRMIASIAEGIDMFGEGGVVTDAYKLLLWRKRASIELLGRRKMLKAMGRYGRARMLIADQKRPFAKGIIAGYIRKASQGVRRVIGIDQVYEEQILNFRKLGFKKDDATYNRGLLKYLMMPADETGRYSDEGLELESALGINEEARMFQVREQVNRMTMAGERKEVMAGGFPVEYDMLRPVKDKIKVNFGQITSKATTGTGKEVTSGKIEMSIEAALDMMMDPKNPNWDIALRSTHTGKRRVARAAKLYAALDDWAVKELGIPLENLVGGRKTVQYGKTKPETLVTNEFFEAVAKEHGLSPRALAKALDPMIMKSYEGKLEMILISQVPQVLVDLGRGTRATYGADIERLPVKEGAVRRLQMLASQVGLDPHSMGQMVRAVLNKDRIVTVHDADVLEETFMSILHDPEYRAASGLPKMADEKRALRHASGKMVTRKVAVPQGWKGGPVSGITDSEKPIMAAFAPEEAGGILSQTKEGVDVLEQAEFIGTKPQSRIKGALASGAGEEARMLEEFPIVKMRKTSPTKIAAAELAVEEADQTYKGLQKIADKTDADLGRMKKTPRYTAAVKNKEELAWRRSFTSVVARATKATKGQAKTGWAVALNRAVPIYAKHSGRDDVEEIVGLAFDTVMSRKRKPKDQAKLMESIAKEALTQLNRRIKSEKALLNEVAKKGDYKAVLSDARAQRSNLIQQRKNANKARKALAKAKDDLHKAEYPPDPGEPLGGIENIDARDVVSPATPSDDLLKYRKQRAILVGRAMEQGFERVSVEAALDGRLTGKQKQDVMDALGDDWERLVMVDDRVRAARHAIQKGDKYVPYERMAGNIRKPTKAGEIEYLVPEGVAAVMDDIYGGKWDPVVGSKMAKFLRMYDGVMHYFKANLLAPHPAYWGRNVIQNSAVTAIKVWSTFLDPTNGFQMARDHLDLMRYVIGKYGDFPLLGKDSEKLGDKVVKTYLGAKVTIRDIAERMEMDGIFRGQTSAEAINPLTIGQDLASRARGAASGGAAGAALGTLAGGAADAALGTQEDGTALDWTSAFGLAAGAVLGGRSMRKAKIGQQYMIGDKITGMLRSDWKPLLEKGEMLFEMPFRTAIYMHEFVGSSSHKAARQSVYDTLNDWNSLSSFEKKIMRRLIPFYSWTKHAVSHTIKEGLTEPSRQGSVYKAFESWNELSNEGPGDKPDYLDNRLALVVKHDSPILGNLVSEDEIAAISGFGLPMEDFSALAEALPQPRPGIGKDILNNPGLLTQPFSWGRKDQRLGEGAQALLSRGPFGAVALMEIAANRDTFTGQEIQSGIETTYLQSGRKWDGAPGWLKHIVGYKPKTATSNAVVDPKVAWMLGEIPHSRFIALMRTVKRQTDEGAKVDGLAIARQFLGASVVIRDKRTKEYMVNRGRINAMAGYLNAVGSLRKWELLFGVDNIRRKR